MKRLLLILLGALAGATMARAQPEGPPTPRRLPAIPGLEARLTALSPDEPLAYYELGEEVAGEAVEFEDFALARQLYVLAFELDRAGPGRGRLGPSICLALARIERLDEVRDWLRATAGTLDPRYVSTDWNVAAAPLATDRTALLVTEALGLTRSGDGPQAMTRLEEPGVRELLARYEPLLSEQGQAGGISRLESQMRSWPCPECKNRRSVTRVGRDGPEVQPCSTCNGDPGPELPQAELIAHLRFESRLLSGLQRSWSAQVASDYGAPLLDPEPAQLGPTLRGRYGVVLGRPYWRDGQWSDNPDGPPSDAPILPPAPAEDPPPPPPSEPPPTDDP
jgi:hypothetical protein